MLSGGMDHPEPSDNEFKAYAAGTLGWAELRKRGVDYAEVLAGLGRLGLRPPIAPLEGPNLAARQRGIARLKGLLGPSGS